MFDGYDVYTEWDATGLSIANPHTTHRNLVGFQYSIYVHQLVPGDVPENRDTSYVVTLLEVSLQVLATFVLRIIVNTFEVLHMLNSYKVVCMKTKKDIPTHLSHEKYTWLI